MKHCARCKTAPIDREYKCRTCYLAWRKDWYKKNQRKVLSAQKTQMQRYRERKHYVWIMSLLNTFQRHRGRKRIDIVYPDRKYLKDLAKKLEKDLSKLSRCPYTGLKIPSGSVSLDHRKSSSKYPGLAYQYKNLQWVHKSYNRAKSDMTDRQFLVFCRKICKIADKKASR